MTASFAPYWDDTATGLMIGISAFTDKRHIARATIESVCFQTKAILDAMGADSGTELTALRVDGGMTNVRRDLPLRADSRSPTSPCRSKPTSSA